jgi:hypothetical protein
MSFHKTALFIVISFLVSLVAFDALGHPMPNSVVLLDVTENQVRAELQLPLSELELAFGHEVNRNSDGLTARLGPELKSYLLQHIHLFSPGGKMWKVSVDHMLVQPVQDSPSGPYKELTVFLTFRPPARISSRNFFFNYDVIIHQVVTHFALVSVRQDWDNGLNAEEPYELGVIKLDIPTNTILPLRISLKAGSTWQGLISMVQLGIKHIKEGTDHLLFLLTLLLPATLLIDNSGKKWGQFGGTKYSLIRILKIVTSFTIGHSITLLIGATGWIHFPAQPIELLIAVSIFISAVQAWRPIFPGRETYVAAGFGLIHGMAFAQTLVNLNLDIGRMALSILGFNLGIELMQIFIITLTIPWLIILSRNQMYSGLRICGALIAAVASVAWMTERISGKANLVSAVVLSASVYYKWLLASLILAAVFSYFYHPKKSA